MKQHFTAAYQKRGKWYLGWVEEIPGVNTQGKTRKEAADNLKEALALIIETNRIVSRKASAEKKVMREPLEISV